MIENEYLVLNKITHGDQEFYNQIYSDSKLLKFVTAPLSTKASNKSFENTINNMACKPPKLIVYCIISKNNTERFGILALKWNQENKQHIEIGVIVLQKHQAQGIAYLAIDMILDYVFNSMDVNKIIAQCDRENKAANGLFKKLKFIQNNIKNQEKVIWQRIK